MSSKTIIAIDPGVSGGIAIKDKDNHTVKVHKMPDTIYDLMNNFMIGTYDGGYINSDFVKGYGHLDFVCVIEQLNAGSQAQGFRKGVKSIWKQSENYTALLCALYSGNIKTIEVAPSKWMSKLSGKRPKDYRERKKWLKQHAQRLYPEQNVTLWNADALCLLHVSKEFID
jgi:hypothetical protein